MKPSMDLRNKLKENYEGLALVEAIDSFDRIRSLVVADSERHPCVAKEALLKLYQLILIIIQEGYIEGADNNQLWRHLGIIEEDVYRIANSAEHILDTVHKIQSLLSDSGGELEE